MSIISKFLFGGSLLINILFLILFLIPRSHHLNPSTDTPLPHIQGMGGSRLFNYPSPTFKQKEEGFIEHQNYYLFPLNPGSFNMITSYYGPRLDVFGNGVWKNHVGIDLLSHTPQANVYAIEEGIVLESHRDFIYGVMVKLEHPDGSTSLYAHLYKETQKKYQLRMVSKGDRVKRGQIIGRIGNTGISTAPHLHFELNVSKEKANNPLKWLKFPGK